jgi:hypothetical protein
MADLSFEQLERETREPTAEADPVLRSIAAVVADPTVGDGETACTCPMGLRDRREHSVACREVLP